MIDVLLITELCSAVIGISAVLALAARLFLRPRMSQVDDSLARIEAHLERLNGSVSKMDEWQRQHDLQHARRERQ